MPLSYDLLNCYTLNDFIQFLINYWKPIVGLLFTIAGFIFALIKKKPISDILTDIYTWSIQAINETELISKTNKMSSETKLARATNFVLGMLQNKYPTLNVDKYFKLIEKVIEDLLGTPHKKGV